MSRWAPNARERLEDAALDLFVENGYEETTVAQIADRAGMNRATFFRHFADKREVLFGGEDVLTGLFADGIRADPDAWDRHSAELTRDIGQFIQAKRRGSGCILSNGDGRDSEGQRHKQR